MTIHDTKLIIIPAIEHWEYMTFCMLGGAAYAWSSLRGQAIASLVHVIDYGRNGSFSYDL